MAENSKIEWTDHTFNPWIGCTKVSPACDHCYAERLMDHRLGRVSWGRERVRTSPAYWRQPLRWNAEAKAAGIRLRVFCASLADVFDNDVLASWRDDLWALIASTPHLDWLLLTKRIGNAAAMLPVVDSSRPGYQPWHEAWPWRNVWLGATVVNQAEADRDIPKLLATPAAKRFLSIEPMLGPINLEEAWHGENALSSDCWGECGWCPKGFPPLHNCQRDRQPDAEREKMRSGIDWVICGGESGPGARPVHPDWVRLLRDECAQAGVPFLFKQWGEWLPWEPDVLPYFKSQAGGLIDRHALPDFNDADLRRWTDARLYEGDDIAVHQRVGKKAAGRLLDGVQHDGMPA